MSYLSFPVATQHQIEEDISLGSMQKDVTYQLEKLSMELGVSTEEIQQVLPSLVRKGLVKSTDEDSIKILGLPNSQVESVFQYAQKFKLKPRTVVREVRVEEADQVIAGILDLDAGDPIFIQVRTRLVDEQVLANQYNFLPYEICPGLEAVDLTRRSFQVTLSEDFHTVITRMEETYFLGTPERDDKEILGVSDDTKILIVQRTSFSRSDYPLVFADIHVNPAQFHYVEDLWPKALPLVNSLK